MRTFIPTLSACTLSLLAATSAQTPHAADYCQVTTDGIRVLAVRPSAAEPPIDDVNWFARPVPNAAGRWIVGFASHDQNYLYDLTRGARVKMPDKSDAVGTPDGRYVTVPSHYTSTRTVNFYETAALLARLDQGRDADDVKPVFAHEDPDVVDVYYQSVGVVSDRREGASTVTVYRMMFSGSNASPAPGFRIVDYTFTRTGTEVKATASRAMSLCPQIARDLSTPFISKDARYVVAHDGGDDTRPGTLKIFEITGVNPTARTTTCERRVDFGFAAGKADFSFDGTRITFHISKYAYLTPFVNGGIVSPTITDVVVADLVRDAQGRITGHGGLARVTTSVNEGVGSYFPAFFPDGRVFYIANSAPKNSQEPKRFHFRVVDPDREVYYANVFSDPSVARGADAVGVLWQRACRPEMQPFKPGEAPWMFMSLTRAQCEGLVRERFSGDAAARADLMAACATRGVSERARR